MAEVDLAKLKGKDMIKQISAVALKARLANNETLFLVDVREPHEFKIAHLPDSISMPLAMIPLRLNELSAAQEIVLICHHGMRSQQAARYLEKQGFKNLVNLSGGIDAWARECDLSMRRY